MKQVTIGNVTYLSLASAWRALAPDSVSFALARKRVQRGWEPQIAVLAPPIPPAFRRTSGMALTGLIMSGQIS